jgi:chain length determinant protein tyrosine kinase EpsG
LGQSNINVIPAASTESATARLHARPLGGILIEAGRLRPEGLERILQLQQEQNLPFGDAGIRLGLLSQADVEFALAHQFEHLYVVRGESAISEELVTAYAPYAPKAEALRGLRTQLMVQWFETDPAHRALAVVSAARREGRSFITANLAVVFAQLGMRTLLVDADMRNSCQHRLFGLDNRSGLSAVLSGRAGPEAVRRVPALSNLSVLTAGVAPPNPSDLLAKPAFGRLLEQLSGEFAIVLLDTPAAGGSSDAQTASLRAGAALIVVRKNTTRVWEVRGIADRAAQGSTTLVGTVLNDF